MINVDLTGNVSDHIIRYCICRSVAEKNNYKLGINPIASHDYYGGKEQMYFFSGIDYGESINTPYGVLPKGIANVWEEKRERHAGYNFHPFQPDIFDVPDNTKLVIYCGQDSNYLIKEKVKEWLQIKEEYIKDAERLLDEAGIELNENICIINARGGEYRGVPSLFLRHEYWENAIQLMKQKNPDIKFIVVTEDLDFYKHYEPFSGFPIYHFGTNTDYYILNRAKNLIVSNSGFGIFPVWLNENNPYAIAPYLWANHNFGKEEEWANSNMRSWGCFTFIDRKGDIVL
jgi:hypothetical protein